MTLISIEFCLIILLILSIFIINISHLLYLILRKNGKRDRFFRSILLNVSFSSLIIAIWLIPFFYFRIIWSPDSLLWRLWSFLFHIVDAVQLYSLLLLVGNTHSLNLSLQRFLICLTWFAPIVTYSPILWLSSATDHLDYLPYRRLSLGVPWWILPALYSTMYSVPILLSFILIGMALYWPWIYNQYKRRINASGRQINEHRENMAELTSLIDTVFKFELEQSSINTMNTWIPSVSSLTNPSSKSLYDMSNKLNQTSILFDDLSSSIKLNNSLQKQQQSFVNYHLLFILTCLLLVVHLPYVMFSLMDIYTSQLPIFIYIHWFGTMFIPIVHLRKHY